MTKLLKKLSIFTTAAFLFILTATSNVTPQLSLPGITVEDTTDKEPETKPMADDEDNPENDDAVSTY